MNSVKVFFGFMKNSWTELKAQPGIYMNSAIGLFFINLITVIPWRGMGYESNSIFEIAANILAAILNLIVIVNIVMIEKAKIKDRPKEGLLYTIPTYLIYTLYCMIIISMGIFLWILPAVLAYLILLMVPLASVLIDNDSINYFKVSFQMFKKEPVLIFLLGVGALFSELFSLLFDFIPDWRVALGVEVVYGVVDTVILILITMTFVKCFYYIKKLLMIKAE